MKKRMHQYHRAIGRALGLHGAAAPDEDDLADMTAAVIFTLAEIYLAGAGMEASHGAIRGLADDIEKALLLGAVRAFHAEGEGEEASWPSS